MTIRLLALGILAFAGGAVRGDDWRYVVPPAGDPHEHAPPRLLLLADKKPDDLEETARYRGKTRRYGQFVYGTPGTGRVAVVLDEAADGSADLYVDTGRLRRVADEDRVAGTDGVWRVVLPAAVAEEKGTVRQKRTVLFRLGKVARTLSVATCGYLEGKTQLSGGDVAVRRVDGDANGLFADSADRLWVDLNGDGRWDAFDEQFLVAPVLTLGGVRFAPRSDPLGRSLTFAKLEGAGTVKVALADKALARRLVDLEVTLLGRDGSVVTLRGRDGSATLPAGDYRLSAVSLLLKDGANGSPWGFDFADRGADKPPPWRTLARGGTLEIDPVGTLRFVAGLEEGSRRARPGDLVSVQPQLYTGDGLLIVGASPNGRPQTMGHDCSATIALAGTTASSGFA